MLKWEVLYILSVENQFQVESPWWFSEASHPRFQVTLHTHYTSPTCLHLTPPSALTPTLIWPPSYIAPISRHRVRTGARNKLGKTSTEPA